LEYLLFIFVLLFGGGLTANKREIISSILNLAASLLVLLRPMLNFENGFEENDDEKEEWLIFDGEYELERVIGLPWPSSNNEGGMELSFGREPTKPSMLFNEPELNTLSKGGGEIICLWVFSLLILLLPGIAIGCWVDTFFLELLIVLLSFLFDFSFEEEEPLFNIFYY